jgi:glycosyltransferase involved in cell wall biosynthesis
MSHRKKTSLQGNTEACLSEEKPLRLLEVLEATTGGTRKHLYYLLKHLDRKRFDITFLYSNQRDPHFSEDLSFYSSHEIRLIEVPMQREISFWHDGIAFLRILRVLWEGHYDVVHAHSSKAGFLTRIAAWLLRVKHILYSPHAFAFQFTPNTAGGMLYRCLERFAGLFHHHLVCVSEGERSVALQYRISPLEKIVVIPNAISVDEISALQNPESISQLLGIADDVPVVGMVAHFRPQKGYSHFINAIPKIVMQHPATRFLIVGDGPLLGEVREQIRSQGLEKNVILAGYQSHPPDFYQIMDIFVLSSLWEGMPYVLLEALAMGLPVVATNTVGNNEIVEHGRNGFLVPPGSSDEIATSVLHLLENPTLRKQMGNYSRHLSKSKMKMQEWAEQYNVLYSQHKKL